MKINPNFNPTSQNLEDPTIFQIKETLNLNIDSGKPNYTGETFSGYAWIHGSVKATFEYCSFYLNSTLRIYTNAYATFNNCNFTLNSLEIKDNASVTFDSCKFTIIASSSQPMHLYTAVNVTFRYCQIVNVTSGNPNANPLTIEGAGTYIFENCTMQTNSLKINGSSTVNFVSSIINVTTIPDKALFNIHDFEFVGNCEVTVNNTKITALTPYLDLLGHAILLICNNSVVNVSHIFNILYNASVTIDNSIVTAETLSVASEHWYQVGWDSNTASLTVTAATVHAPIIDSGKVTTVTIQDSTVDTLTKTLWVNGSNPVTMTNNNITGNDTDDWWKTATLVGDCSIAHNQTMILADGGAKIHVESSEIYALVAAWNSSITVSNSNVTSALQVADHATLEVNGTTTILGSDGMAEIYGSVGARLGTYVRENISHLFNSSIYLLDCEISGTVFLPGNTTSTFTNCILASPSFEIANTTNTTFGGLIDFIQSNISGEIRLTSETTLVLQHSTYETITYLNDTKESLVIKRSGPEINILGLITNMSGRDEAILSANLTVNNATVPADPSNPLHFTLDPFTHQVPGQAVVDIIAYNTTDYNDLNFTRSFTLEIPSDAVHKQLLWETTADFQDNANNNCTIGTNNLTLGDAGIAFDFNHDAVGSNPSGWTTSEPASTSIAVTSNYSDHTKVTHLDDDSTSGYCDFYNDFSGQSNGSIEFWFLMPDVSCPLQIQLKNSDYSQYIAQLSVSYDYGGVTQDYLAYHHVNGSWCDLVQLTDNTWYHVRLTFDCTNGNYDGLNQYTYRLYLTSAAVNQTFGPYVFYSNESDVGRFRFNTYDFPRQVSEAYLDAIDYFWAPNYYANRSYIDYGEKQDYLSFSIWQSQITNPGEPAPYYENITSSYTSNPNTSTYLSYQMSNDTSTWERYNGSAWEPGWSSWTNSSTVALNLYGKRYFQVRALLNTSYVRQTPVLKWINVSYILHFEDVLWNETDDFEDYSENNCTILNGSLRLAEIGVAYDFSHDTVGSDPSGWVTSEPASTSIAVASSHLNHSKVVHLDDDSTSSYLDFYNTSTGQSYGAVEFWILLPDVSCPLQIQLKNSQNTQYVTQLTISYDYGGVTQDYLAYRNTNGTWCDLVQLTDDSWYYMRLTFDCTNGNYTGLDQYTYCLYLTNTTFNQTYGPYVFYSNEADVGRVRFNTYDYPRQTSEVYLDAIDFSWTPGYFPDRSYDYYGTSLYANMSMWTSNAVDFNITTPYYENITFICETNNYTTVVISYRWCTDSSFIGTTWGEEYSQNISVKTYGERYFQVRAKLNTTNWTQTPELHTITVKVYYF